MSKCCPALPEAWAPSNAGAHAEPLYEVLGWCTPCISGGPTSASPPCITCGTVHLFFDFLLRLIIFVSARFASRFLILQLLPANLVFLPARFSRPSSGHFRCDYPAGFHGTRDNPVIPGNFENAVPVQTDPVEMFAIPIPSLAFFQVPILCKPVPFLGKSREICVPSRANP